MLSDSKIKEALGYKDISILPLGENAIQPASVDLRLGEEILIQQSDGTWKTHNLRLNDYYLMYPGDFILGATYEWITIGPKYVGEMVGRSSRAREGIIVEAAGHFDSGWDGFGTVELSNRGRVGVKLVFQMGICQIRFHVVDGTVERLYGSDDLGSHYQLAMGPEKSWTQQVFRLTTVGSLGVEEVHEYRGRTLEPSPPETTPSESPLPEDPGVSSGILATDPPAPAPPPVALPEA